MNFPIQFFKYVFVGGMTNFVGYSLYLLFTYLFGSPKLVMTLLYFVGALVGFFANRRLTFCHKGHIGKAGFRYFLVQIFGYLLNLIILISFVDWFGFSHQFVQAAAIVVVAVFSFLLLRFAVFSPDVDGTRKRKL